MPKVIDYIKEPERNIPVWYDVDVLVCGGGTAGVAAAVCAGRMGLSVVMVEMTAQPGGMTNNLTWLSDFGNKGGFAKEWFEYVSSVGAYKAPNYNPFVVTPYYDNLLRDSNVRALYFAVATAPLMENNRIVGAILETKSGRGVVKSKIVIDATGDGDIAVRAGAEFHMGRETDGACQAISISSILVNWASLRMDKDTAYNLSIEAGKKASTEYRFPYERWAPKPVVGVPDVSINAVPHAMGYDATDVESFSNAIIELRNQAVEMVDTLSKHTNEFASVRLGPFLGLPGVRESRRIVTDRMITKDDALNGRRFDDGIFVIEQNIDIHKCIDGEPAFILMKTKPYHLSYAALLPKELENILVVGRCIGGDHEAMASYRIVADCFAMGEAAALAAKNSIDKKESLRSIDVSIIQTEMSDRGYEV